MLTWLKRLKEKLLPIGQEKTALHVPVDLKLPTIKEIRTYSDCHPEFNLDLSKPIKIEDINESN
jgi:hypothetical protein